MATGGATGGGKARGSGQEGLQGESPPPNYAGLKPMEDWQKRIRQEAQRIAGQLQVVRVQLPSLEEAIRLMQKAEQAAAAGRYRDMFRVQQMVLQTSRRRDGCGGAGDGVADRSGAAVAGGAAAADFGRDDGAGAGGV